MEVKQYHKVLNVFASEGQGKTYRLLDGVYKDPVFGLLKDLGWTFTEKVDGTNIRVIWDGGSVEYRGKSDNAQIPGPLVKHLQDTLPAELLSSTLKGPVVLFGEGYGGKIQKGSGYRPDQAFILFDVFVQPTEEYPSGIWLERDVVEDIGAGLGIPVVPIIASGTLDYGVQIAREGFASQLVGADVQAEGLMARPSVELRDRMGRRVICKLKTKALQSV